MCKFYHPQRNTVRRWIKRYEETSDVKCNHQGPRPITYTNEFQRHREIVRRHTADPFTTTRSTAQIYGISLDNGIKYERQITTSNRK